MRGASSSNCDYHEVGNIPSSVSNVFKKWDIFFIFFLYFLCENLSFVHVNSINCIVMCGAGCISVKNLVLGTSLNP